MHVVGCKRTVHSDKRACRGSTVDLPEQQHQQPQPSYLDNTATNVATSSVHLASGRLAIAIAVRQ
eukprot:9118859-Alexandrium_andersonii.AAC.1